MTSPEAPGLSPVGALARAGDEDRFLAALCAPAAMRERLFALIAFNAELAKIPASVSEPLLGEIRLTWWAEALDDLFDRGAARGHEAMQALAAAHGAAPLHRPSLERLVSARRFALGLEDAGDLDRYLADTGGAYAEAAVRALGGDERAAAAAGQAGWAEGAGRLIAALPAMLAAGEAPFGEVDRAALERGEVPAPLAAAIRDLADRGLAALAAARAARAAIPRSARAPLMSVHGAERTLRLAAALGFDPFTADAPSPFRARAVFLVRAAFGRF